ncbi:MAG: alpha/beta hydrolase [Anaerolineales bacterium]|nr:alpha/beta hydrolase [Anaerolineales bacterium]
MKYFWNVIAVLVAFAMIAVNAGCGQLIQRNETTANSTTLQNPQIKFKWVKCPYGNLPIEIDCGYLVVPANHFNPQDGKIRLPVTILRSKGNDEAAEALVYLAGGPGSSAMDDIQAWLDQPYLKDRDLILFDQRGSGKAEPSLNCYEVEKSTPKDRSKAIQQCYKRLKGQGIDLNVYNSAQSAADLNALRNVLNYESWDLLGVSYGTRLALTMLRDFPQGIRSVILDSVYPLEVNAYEERAVNGARAIETLFHHCAEDESCAHAYPDLPQVFEDLLITLDNNPSEVKVTSPLSGEEVRITLNGSKMASLVFEALYHPETIARIPYVIYEAQYGYREAIAGLMFPQSQEGRRSLIQSRVSNRLYASEGSFFSVECNEEVRFNSLTKAESAIKESKLMLARYLFSDVRSIFEFCQIWDSGIAREVENQPVTSTIPALIFAGEYDPATPPTWGEQVARNLSNSYYYLFPAAGHAVIDSGECPSLMIAEFLANPTTPPPATCLQDQDINFWTP